MLLKKAEEFDLPVNLCFDDWHKLDNEGIEKIIKWLWKDQTSPQAPQLIQYVQNAKERLETLIKQ